MKICPVCNEQYEKKESDGRFDMYIHKKTRKRQGLNIKMASLCMVDTTCGQKYKVQ